MNWVKKEIERVMGLNRSQLRAEYAAVWGEEVRSNNRVYIIKKIIARMQMAREGGLSIAARQRAADIGKDEDIRSRPRPEVHAAYALAAKGTSRCSRPLPPIGSVLTREYKGRRLAVTVQADGFLFEGKHFQSLTEVARVATGSNWNGRLFFKLTTREKH